MINEVLRKFNLKRFENLHSLEEKIMYAKKMLPLFGEGDARIVFAIATDKVLKIAKNEKGFGQNEAEVDMYTNTEYKDIFAKIFKTAPDYSWIISEAVKEFSSNDEFKRYTDLDLAFVSQATKEWALYNYTSSEDLLENIFDEMNTKLKQAQLLKQPIKVALLKNRISYVENAKNNEFFHKLLGVVDEGLVPADLGKVGHYGKTLSGKPVILDYGYTFDVLNKYY